MLLQQVANRLGECLRDSETVCRLARFGGDEFVVLLEDLSSEVIVAASQAKVVGERILECLNQPYKLGTHEYHSTVSVGAVLFNNHKESHEELIKHADIAMYQAKKSGRNNMRFYDPEMQEAIRIRVDVERDLRKAIEQNQFHLFYQIQVGSDYKPIGAEALIRWLHPDQGIISPLHFITLAEETGLIVPIGQWVIETACSQLKRWENDSLMNKLTISVNVSVKQFRQSDFAAQIKATIGKYSINPSLLKLEITESILLENVEESIAILTEIQDLGCKFSLDDFGTGYSSLQYLKRLPLHQLKIDQSFVRDLVEDGSDKAIIRTIIAMAKSMELEVIAEGVETDGQLAYLNNYGCKCFQGYLFGKPLPIDQFEVRITQEQNFDYLKYSLT